MKDKLAHAINEQINKEYYSAFLYLAMSEWFSSQGLPGAANWTYLQYLEELSHAQNLYAYLQYRGVPVVLKQIDDPSGSWSSPLDVFEHVLRHEQLVTASINDLADLAQADKDHAAAIFLQWYVIEQVEEEASVQEIIDRLTWIQDSKNGLMRLDDRLAKRTFTPPVVPGLPGSE